MYPSSIISLLLLFPLLTSASPILRPRADPQVQIPSPPTTIIGETIEDNNVETFEGIPYAQPPTNTNRLKPPVRLTTSTGTFTAKSGARACPQFFLSIDKNNLPWSLLGSALNLPLFQSATEQGEDCLTINVRRPVGTTADSKLPVLFWIFGGGFQLGWSSMYSGTSLVEEGVSSGKPFIFVAVNYRVGGFGFLPGKEVKADGAGNLGLLDQRMGLEWVQDNIAAFGGDPEKVTIWGESAGAISVFNQMALFGGNIVYKSKPLFRAAIMNSGSIAPVQDIDHPKAQAVYDDVVNSAGCGGTADSLACLRGLSYTDYLNAANSVALSYLPRPDGTAFVESPEVIARKGTYAGVPMICGNQEDEGTIFALFQSNISNTAEINTYLKDYYFPEATSAQVSTLVASYPEDASSGSPFRSGSLWNWYPTFKRLAAILGDFTFTLARRIFLTSALAAKPNVPIWSYLSSYNQGFPVLGTFHASDLLEVFYGILPNYASRSTHSYYFNFLYTLDPNDEVSVSVTFVPSYKVTSLVTRASNAFENATLYMKTSQTNADLLTPQSGGVAGVTSDTFMNWPKYDASSRQLMNFLDDRGTLITDDFRTAQYNVLAASVGSLRL